MSTEYSTCPDENLLSSWAVGACTVEESKALSAHVETCPACQATFASVVAAMRMDQTLRSPERPAPSDLLASAAPVAPGDILLGKYEVERVLGSGGMGVVVRARHLQLNGHVALKFIRPELSHDRDVLSRFSREARAAARLTSPFVNRVLDLGVLPTGIPFMVMEYLEGETLEARLRREGPQPPARVVAWMRDVLQGLAEAHALGIVHRDLKPANLFLQKGEAGAERLKILDFGIAKSVHPDIEAGLQHTSHQMLVGSPAYMAPEQLTPGAEVDARADVWAAGCTMFALLTGHPPFGAGDLVDLAWKVRNAPAPELPPGALADCVRKCLSKDQAQRYRNADELAASMPQPDALFAPAAPRRRWGLAVGGAIAVLGIAAVGAWTARQPREPSPAPAPVPSRSVVVEPLPSVPAPAAAIVLPPPPPSVAMETAPPTPAPLVLTRPARAKSRRTTALGSDAGSGPGVGADDVFGERF